MRRFAIAFILWTVVAVLFAGQLAVDSAYTGHRVTPRGALISGRTRAAWQATPFSPSF